MTRQPPPERTLPNKQQILDQVLAGHRSAKGPHRKRPGWLVPLVAAGAVAAIIGAILIVPQTLKSGDPAVKPAEAEISLDLGPLSQAEIGQILRQCPFMHGTSSKRLLHARKVRAGWGDGVEWTLAREGRSVAGSMVGAGDGRLTACTGRPGKSAELNTDVRLEEFVATVGRALTPEELAKLPKGASFVTPRYDDGFLPQEMITLEARPARKWASALWLRVPPVVDRVRQRIVVDGKPQQWFGSDTVDGLNFTQAWIDAPISKSAKITFDVQFLDKSGEPVEIPGSTGLTTEVACGGKQLNRAYNPRDYWVS